MKFKAFSTFVVLLLTASGLFAQQNQIKTIDQHTYTYIKNLQQRGMMLSLNPTSQPYTQKEIVEALKDLDDEALSPVESFWKEQIESEINITEYKPDDERSVYASFRLDPYTSVRNYRRPSGLRPANNKNFLFSRVSGEAYIEYGMFGGQFGGGHETFKQFDTDTFDQQGTLSYRNEDYYFGIQHGLLKFYIGRFNNNWGLYNEGSAILSDNPASYDHINFTFGNSRVSLQGILGELDNLAPDGTFRPGNITNGERRYIASQRLNWRPVKNIQLVLFMSALYSSENTNATLRYLNPFNPLLSDRNNYPMNEDNNTLIGGSLWGNFGKFNLHGQIILDDMHYNNNEERMTLSAIGSMRLADAFKNTDIGLNAEMISYQSYNTTASSIAGRYVYVKKGLATQFNDYIYLSAYSEIYAHELAEGLIIEPRVGLLFQGEQTINQPFYRTNPDGSLPDFVLTGVVETTLRNSLRLFYHPRPQYWLETEIGYNTYDNQGNIEDATGSEFTFNIKLGIRIFTGGFIKDWD